MSKGLIVFIVFREVICIYGSVGVFEKDLNLVLLDFKVFRFYYIFGMRRFLDWG